MIPQLLTVRITRPTGRPIRIWLPVLPVLLVLSPILVPAVLGAAVACRLYRVGVARAFGAGWRFVCALRGIRFDIEQGPMAVLVTIR
ncbi:hypothetical protein [Catellatospora tritici]|uniref:hypothetical protein n=1 Tax=Catellatospora tritici TaxID=2851566 RepID=UPI001C2D6AA0|nr:hypothetical protein [Catellatospora tritici]MBV1855142.1 hypothetical protein [Catellatospora tritici]